MMKYPIGIQSFEQIIKDGYVYVDKTALIYDLVTRGKIYFLSRPRRFGKSLLMSTLENYFLGRKELFEGLAISSLEKEWLEYPVFHIDFNAGNFKEAGTLEGILDDTVSAWESIYPPKFRFTSIGKRFQEVLRTAHEQTGRRCVVLIDEYDKPLLDVLDTGLTCTVDGQERMLVQGRRRRPAVRAPYGRDQVLAGQCVQRVQPAEGYQHGQPLRRPVRNNPGGTGALF